MGFCESRRGRPRRFRSREKLSEFSRLQLLLVGPVLGTMGSYSTYQGKLGMGTTFPTVGVECKLAFSEVSEPFALGRTSEDIRMSSTVNS